VTPSFSARSMVLEPAAARVRVAGCASIRRRGVVD
jgi:hypothetical protein